MWAYPLRARTVGERPKRGELFALALTGKIAVSTGVGNLALGKVKLGADIPMGGIYQRRHSRPKSVAFRGEPGTVPDHIIMKTYAPTNPRTTAQQSQRAKMTAAVAAWQALTLSEKHDYNSVAARRSRRGVDLFISEYLKAH